MPEQGELRMALKSLQGQVQPPRLSRHLLLGRTRPTTECSFVVIDVSVDFPEVTHSGHCCCVQHAGIVFTVHTSVSKGRQGCGIWGRACACAACRGSIGGLWGSDCVAVWGAYFGPSFIRACNWVWAACSAVESHSDIGRWGFNVTQPACVVSPVNFQTWTSTENRAIYCSQISAYFQEAQGPVWNENTVQVFRGEFVSDAEAFLKRPNFTLA